ncbi:hypothetical protein ASF92_16540 [Pedobacter sp. Leaf176]|nr:hypothetical protein ASF92_16540 [Pedobacter sp. Leaf176]
MKRSAIDKSMKPAILLKGFLHYGRNDDFMYLPLDGARYAAPSTEAQLNGDIFINTLSSVKFKRFCFAEPSGSPLQSKRRSIKQKSRSFSL